MQAGPHALPHAPPPHTRTSTHFLAPTTTLLVACSLFWAVSHRRRARPARLRAGLCRRYPSCLLSCTASFVEMLRDAGSSISTFARLTHSLPATRYSLLATRYSHLAAPTCTPTGGLLPLLGGKSPMAECGTPAQPTNDTPRPHGHRSAHNTPLLKQLGIRQVFNRLGQVFNMLSTSPREVLVLNS